ncbi:MAG: ATP-binding protein [Clostridiales bacterium]|nr:ATP-binding protein [Clostridiales bacterium]
MVILIAGASHTGKTALAQRLLEKYKYPYLSIDHLKMGLIRSNNTSLKPDSDDKALTDYLWNIVKEIVKTAVENKQDLIIEGCYIPYNWTESFNDDYLKHIKYRCLVMSETYIRNHFGDIKKYASTIEDRLDDSYCTIETLLHDNDESLRMCKLYNADYILIDDTYNVDIALQLLD